MCDRILFSELYIRGRCGMEENISKVIDKVNIGR
jgi:hypothetical protein